MTNPYSVATAFTRTFRDAEYSLKRSGFVRENKVHAEADWDRFARQLGPDFYEHITEKGLAQTLIGHPPRKLLSNMKWSEPSEPLANSFELIVHGVCRVRNSYIHGEKFTGGPEGQWGRDAELIQEAHAVLKEALAFAAGAILAFQGPAEDA